MSAPAVGEQIIAGHSLKGLGVGTWSWNIRSQTVLWSPELCALFGVPAESYCEASVEGFCQIVHNEDRAGVIATVSETLAQKREGHEQRFRILRPDGAVRHILSRARLELDSRGEPVRLSGIDIDVTAEESETAKANERLRLALAATDAGIWDFDLASGEVQWTPECFDIMGADPGNGAPGYESWLNAYVHPDDRERLHRDFTAFLNSDRQSSRYEYRIHHPAKGIRWIYSTSHVVRAEGSVQRIVGLNIDITARRQAEEEVRRSEAFSRAVLEASPDCLKVLDPQGRLQFMNANGCTVMEIEDSAPLCGHDWRSFWPQPGQALVDQALAKARSGEASRFEAFCPTAKGSSRWWDVAVMPSFDGEGQVSRIIATSRDITERKEAEKTLHDSRKRLKLGIAIAGFGLGTIDYRQNAITLDERAAEIFGLPADAPLPRQAVHQLFHPDDAGTLQARITALMAADGGEFMAVEHRTVRPDGTILWLNVRKQIARDAEHRPVSGILAVQDVTERKHHEEHQKLLLNELNHRVKNTLVTVQSMAAQSLRNSADIGQARENFEARLIALAKAHDVLTLEKWEGASLGDIVDKAIAPYRGQGTDRFAMTGPKTRVNAKFMLALTMALHELCTNAVKYGALSKEGGKVTIAWNIWDKGGSKQLDFEWRETGGPPVVPPARRGFGSRLIERGLAHDLGGEVKINFAPEGVVCVISAPLPQG